MRYEKEQRVQQRGGLDKYPAIDSNQTAASVRVWQDDGWYTPAGMDMRMSVSLTSLWIHL